MKFEFDYSLLQITGLTRFDYQFLFGKGEECGPDTRKQRKLKLKLSLTFSGYPGGGTFAVMATFFAHYEVAVISITNIHAIILINKMKKIFHLLQSSLGNKPWGRGLPYKNDQGALAIPFGC